MSRVTHEQILVAIERLKETKLRGHWPLLKGWKWVQPIPFGRLIPSDQLYVEVHVYDEVIELRLTARGDVLWRTFVPYDSSSEGL